MLTPSNSQTKTPTDMINRSGELITAAEVLKKARNLISKPENWTQGYAARNKLGAPVHIYSEDANCFCAVGAVGRAVHELELNSKERDVLLLSYFDPVLHTSVAEFNDSNTHNKVLELFDKAIAEAKLCQLNQKQSSSL